MPTDASIKIYIGDDRFQAKSYDVNSENITFFQNNGKVLLRQQLIKGSRQPVFWTNRVEINRHNATTLTVPTAINIEQSGGVVLAKPVYVFDKEPAYKAFQTHVHQASFEGDYLTKAVTPFPETAGGLEERAWACIKLWHDGYTGASSIVVALTNRLHNRTELLELQCSWLEFEKGEAERSAKLTEKPLRLNLRGKKPKKLNRTFSIDAAATSKFKMPLRNLTWGHKSSSSSPAHESAPSSSDSSNEVAYLHDPVPSEIRAKLDGLDITFDKPALRSAFYNSIRLSVGQPTSPIRSAAGSVATSIAENHPGPSRGSSVYSHETYVISKAGSPLATSPRADTGDFASRMRTPSQPDVRHDTPTQEKTTKLEQADWIHGRGDAQISPIATSPPHGPLAGASDRSRRLSSASPSTSRPALLRKPSESTRSKALDLGITSPDSPSDSPSLPVQTQLERQRYWERQFKTAALAGPALERAELNHSFYTQKLQAQRQLRLLTIMPATSRTSDIELSFDIYNMSDVENTYEALSYCWGPGQASRAVMLNGMPGFVVSLHLELALRRLRLAKEPRPLWIDAICINQASLDEMNHQVQLMGHIYELARRTIIWVGELTPDMPTCPRRVAADGDDNSVRTLCTKDGEAAGSDHGLRDSIQEPLRKFIAALRTDPTHNGWHRRLWCVQEFHFSKGLPSVYVGAHAISWSHYTKVFEEASEKAGGERKSLALFENLRKSGPTLHELCRITGSLKVGNPRDRIYSLLHMSAGALRMLTPEYQKSILEVFEDATLYFIRESGSVDVLLDRRLDRTRGDGYSAGVLPTFVPDLTRLQNISLTKGAVDYDTGDGQAAETALYSTSNQEPSDTHPRLMATPRVLGLKARFFDKIKRRTHAAHYPDYETSPAGQLIYNGFQEPGRLVDIILSKLKCHFDKNMKKRGLNRGPQLGRLILEYLLEETRRYTEEMQICVRSTGTNLQKLYKKECERDQGYAIEATPERSALYEQEQSFITNHWQRRAACINEDDATKIDLKRILNERETDWPWDQILEAKEEGLREDVQAAMEFENLFCYARKTRNHYYLFKKPKHGTQKHYRPMRRDVLECSTLDRIAGLPTQADDPDDAVEMHEYDEKVRERDFFATEDGFFGLGPSTMEPGDHIVVPLGASRPFILRPCNEPGFYTLIGEAIVPRIMHGEWNEVEIEEFMLK